MQRLKEARKPGGVLPNAMPLVTKGRCLCRFALATFSIIHTCQQLNTDLCCTTTCMLQMSYSALLFYGYVFLLGLVLYFALRWFRSEIKLVNVWCIYGYSLTIFIPVSFLCIIPIGWVRWLVVGLATSISGEAVQL